MNQIASSGIYHSMETPFADQLFRPLMKHADQVNWATGYFVPEMLGDLLRDVNPVHSEVGINLIVSDRIDRKAVEYLRAGYRFKEELNGRMGETPIAMQPREKARYLSDAEGFQAFIAKGLVNIKVAHSSGGELFHPKYGVISSNVAGDVGFLGSNNLTVSGMKRNYETLYWTVGIEGEEQAEKVHKLKSEFAKLWESQEYAGFHITDFNSFDWDAKFQAEDKEEYMSKIVPLESIPNSLVLDIDSSGHLFLVGNLPEGRKLDKRDLAVRRLAHFFEEFPVFRGDLSYLDMDEIIDRFRKRGEKKGFTVIVSDRLQAYMASQAYYIEERSRYGLIIKDKHKEVAEKFESFKTIVDSRLVRRLRPQQMWSAFYMAEMKKAANFSVPGAGKTSMVYGAFAYWNAMEEEGRPLVERIVMVGPKSSFVSWKDEFVENFGLGKLDVLDIHQEDNVKLMLEMYGKQKNLILVNYEALPTLEESLLRVIDDRTLLVFDEVHKIKGLDAKRPKHALEISKKTQYKFVLTGTPIPNSYEDIYNFLNVLYGEEYDTFFNFSPFTLKNPSREEEEQINEKLRPFFWRTTKKQLGVPAPNPDDILRVPTTQDESRMLEMLIRKYRRNPLQLYVRLTQASTNPALILKSLDGDWITGSESVVREELLLDAFMREVASEEEVNFNADEEGLLRRVADKGTSKYNAGKDLVEGLVSEGKNVLVWCLFVKTIDQLQEDLKSNGIDAAVIYGQTDDLDRARIIKDFQEGRIPVLITNPHTLAESVSLHKVCHDAVYLEYSYNLTHMLQSRDRIHRLGLPDGQYTRYYYLMMDTADQVMNAIDGKVYQRLKEKEERMLVAIEQEDLFLEPQMTLDDIKEIVGFFG